MTDSKPDNTIDDLFAGRDSDERISLSDVDVVADTRRASNTPSSTPPPPPLQALRPVVIPRLVPMSSESLMPPVVPPSDPPPRPEPPNPSVPPVRPRRARPARARQAAQEDEPEDERDVVDIRWVLAAAVLLAVVIGTWTLARRGEPQLTGGTDLERIPLRLSGVPEGARVELDGRPVTGNELTVRGGVRHAVEVHVEGRETWRQVFITNGELELVVQRGPLLSAASPTASPSARLDAGVAPSGTSTAAAAGSASTALPTPPAVTAEPTREPAAPSAESTRPTTSTSTASSTATSTSSSTGSTGSTTRPTVMRASTLVRDPGF